MRTSLGTLLIVAMFAVAPPALAGKKSGSTTSGKKKSGTPSTSAKKSGGKRSRNGKSAGETGTATSSDDLIAPLTPASPSTPGSDELIAPLTPARPETAQGLPPSARPRVLLTAVETSDPGDAAAAEAFVHALEQNVRAFGGVDVLTANDFANLLALDRQTQLLGCADAGCASALGQLKLGASDDVITSGLKRDGGKWSFVAERIPGDGSAAKRHRASRTVDAPTASAADASAKSLVAELFPERAGSATPNVATNATAPAKPASRGTNVIRVAVPEPKIVGDVPERPAAALRQAITPELRKIEGLSAISSAEIADMLSLEREKELVGCNEDTTCISEIAGALDADEMVVIEVVLVGQTYSLSARRTDVRNARVVQTYLKQFEKRDGEELMAVVAPMFEALYPERPLKPGRVRGVETELIRRLNPPPLPRWVFVTTGAAAGAALAAGGVFGYLSLDAQNEYAGLIETSRTAHPVAASELNAVEAKGRSRASTANTLLGAGAALALATGVEAFFTDWKDDRAALQIAPAVSPGGAAVAVAGTF